MSRRAAILVALMALAVALTAGCTFWQLEPGVNIVTFSAPSGSAEVAIEYVSRYTGV